MTPAAVATPRGPVPSMEMRFVPTQRMMKLLAHKSLSFVIYAEPAATPTPLPTGSAKKFVGEAGGTECATAPRQPAYSGALTGSYGRQAAPCKRSRASPTP